jgi:probable HAF family extracellular repeat protein
MSHITRPTAGRYSIWVLPLLMLGLAGAQSAGAHQPAMPAHGPAAATTYTVVNLGTGVVQGVPVINSFEQVAYTLGGTGFFYDGKTIFQIPGTGGLGSVVTGLNDKGQVVGRARVGNTSDFHAFIWTRQAGTRDLGTLGGFTFSEAVDINNHGTVIGDSQVPRPGQLNLAHATRWTFVKGSPHIQDLGTLVPNQSTIAVAINDAGLIAGYAGITPSVSHAFAWTSATGLIDIGTLGCDSSDARAVGANGEVAGNSTTRRGALHAFLWTRATGIQDLGTAGGTHSAVVTMSPNGHIVGTVRTQQGMEHAMSWTRATGMKDLGTLPGALVSMAWGVNNVGQVVGESQASGEPFHAFLWTAASGMIDLNKRVPKLPRGMLLETALAISDSGSIVVRTNTGLVLLKPGRCHCGAALGPIAAADTVAAGAVFEVSASIADENPAATHAVTWSWGDGSSDPARNAIERGGDGSILASHIYAAPGTYVVTARVTDKSGHSALVSRKVTVQAPSGSPGVAPPTVQ